MSGIKPVNPKADPRNQTAQMNANFAQLQAESVRKAFKGPTGKDAFIQGQLPDDLGSGILMNDLSGVPNIYMATKPNGEPVLKVAKTGQNATTADDENLILNSERNTLKIIQSGTTTVSYTIPATVQIFSQVIPHGLSYTPIVLAWQTEPTFGTQTILPNFVYTYDTTVNALVISLATRVVADATNLTFQVIATSTMTSPGAIAFRYYVISESL